MAQWGSHDPQVLAVIKQFRSQSRLRCCVHAQAKGGCVDVFRRLQRGNAMDRFNVEIVNYDELNDEGFQISLPLVSVEIESSAPPEKVRVRLELPRIRLDGQIFQFAIQSHRVLSQTKPTTWSNL